MEEYKISLIVPVYNAEAYLKRCVDSLLAQTYDNLEIILIDDGSVDQSGKLCDAYGQQSKMIKVVHKKNGGLVSAWKEGVKESTGEYFCFVDSDDWVDAAMVSEMAEYLTGNKREIISSDYVIERDGGSSQKVYQGLPPGVYDAESLKDQVVPRLLGNERRLVCLSRCMKLISRELIISNCKYSDPAIRMGEDVTVMFPALIDCERLVVMDRKTFYHYFYADSSMVHQYNSGLYEDIQLLSKIIGRIIEDKFTGSQREQMQGRADQEYLHLMLLVIKNEARGNREGYRRNIFEICRKEEVQSVVRNVTIKVAEKSNRLLYLVLRHPNHVTVTLLRAAMILYYRKG